VPWQPNSIPWDVYVDDRKLINDYALGFLEVANTAPFLHKLTQCRQRAHIFMRREIHWNRPHLDSLDVSLSWIDCVFQHRCVRFVRIPWPAGQTKEFVVLRQLDRFCRRKRLSAPYNVVVFLDFDSDHAKARIQNTVRETGNIARCYHLDSLNNDCLQCADLLLGCTSLLHDDSTVIQQYQSLLQKHMDRTKLKDSEIKRLLAGHLAAKIDVDGTKIFDPRMLKKPKI
jgi:hypothetical protein